jgi:hypothetical protein
MNATTKKILIGAGAAVLLTGIIILSVKGAKNRKVKKDCEEAGGEWDRKKKKCLSEDGNLVVVDEQTKSDIGSQVNVHPTLKYTNVRSTPELDDGALGTWFGVRLTDGNYMGKVTKSPVGTITKAEEGSDNYTWYKLKLTKSLDGKTTGYVREDAISFT